MSISYDKAVERHYDYVYIRRGTIQKIMRVIAKVMARDIGRWDEGTQSLVKHYSGEDESE